jgi:hypothetical protein
MCKALEKHLAHAGGGWHNVGIRKADRIPVTSGVNLQPLANNPCCGPAKVGSMGLLALLALISSNSRPVSQHSFVPLHRVVRTEIMSEGIASTGLVLDDSSPGLINSSSINMKFFHSAGPPI